MNNSAIAIFVKTPGFSSVKTRLAASIGTQLAQQFYRLCIKAVENTVANLCAERPITPYWAVAEQEATNAPIWSGFEQLYAGGSNLGLCQHRIYSQLLKRFERVVLIGADSPQISPALLSRAIDSLDNCDFAMGPAQDGGYYLLAGKAPIEKSIWASVQYSCPTTAQQLSWALSARALATQRPAAPIELLPTLTDVDTVDDLTELLTQMPVDASSQAQLDIREWIGALDSI